jgi:hypothetical protein
MYTQRDLLLKSDKICMMCEMKFGHSYLVCSEADFGKEKALTYWDEGVLFSLLSEVDIVGCEEQDKKKKKEKEKEKEKKRRKKKIKRRRKEKE